jgi:hypothetical protein
MKRALLYILFILYFAFVSIDFLTASRNKPAPWNVILKLLFSLGCVIWIHLDQWDIFDPVDFDLIRIFLLFMFLTDFILGLPAKIEGLAGQLFFIAGILSACFGQFALILRHLRLSVFNRTKSIRGVSLNPSRKTQIRYGSIFILAAALILFAGLVFRGINSSPFAALYFLISIASLASAFSYLLSKNLRKSRLFAFLGVLLLFISDSFVGFGSSIVNDPSYLDLVVWGSYAPVLLVIGSSILELKPRRKDLSRAAVAEG